MVAAEFCHIVRQLMGFFLLFAPNFLRTNYCVLFRESSFAISESRAGFCCEKNGMHLNKYCASASRFSSLLCILSHSLGALPFKRDEFKVDPGGFLFHSKPVDLFLNI